MLMPKNPTLRRQRQGEYEFEANPGYTERPTPKTKSGNKHKDFLISKGVNPYILGRERGQRQLALLWEVGA